LCLSESSFGPFPGFAESSGHSGILEQIKKKPGKPA